MSRRVDPANPSLETHHLAGDPESRLPKAPDVDRAPPAARPPGRRIRSSEPRIVGRIAGSGGLPAANPAPQPRWIGPDRPPATTEPGDSGGSSPTTSRGWRFWRRPNDETAAEETSAPGPAGSGAPDLVMDREAGLAAAFASAFRLDPETQPAEANEDQPLPDPESSPPAESALDAIPEPDSDGEAEGAAVDQADEEEVPSAPTVDTESEPVAAEPQAVADEAERQPEPEPEALVAPVTEEAAPEAEAAAPEAQAEPVPEAAAPETQAEPEPESETEQAPEANAETEPEPEPEPAPEPAPEPERKAEAKAEPDAEATAPDAEAAPQSEPEAQAEPEPQAELEAQAEPEAEQVPTASVTTAEAEPAGSSATSEAQPQAEPEPTTVAAARKRPSRQMLVAGGIAGLAAAVGIGTAIAVTSGSSQPARRTSGTAAPTTVTRPPSAPSAGPVRPVAPIQPAAIAGARAWMKANIARSQRISAEPDIVSELRSAGFTAAHVAPGYPGAPDWRSDNVIISTPATRAEAASVPALTAELASSIPVAVFGTGTQSVEARMVFGTNNPDILSVQAQRQDDATNRRLAGEALLRNPRVTIAPSWSTLVATGGLDLRPAVVIGLIAARTDVVLVAVKVDPAENAAGTPARTVRLSIPPSVLPGILATLPAGYRPDRISSPTQSNTQLTELSWGVTLTPQPTLS